MDSLLVFGETHFEVTYPGVSDGYLKLDGEEVKPGDPVKPGGSYYF